ncbi:glycosyltransferase [Psychrobacter sp. N25K4-3-2]|uniref:glycosyltransferase n=1 Tax=Psychrobacter sp. N25K4-3-2 TaxID=2785026 RepID=UPI001889E675|nr:glycosyltransferase [Psychrobacter sp. N25K4-3-2]MBF4490025.1 glycosyltransferase [Psychrobacter sp. N25K4-3-2]
MINKIAVFGDISANGVDGSSIWMQSICNLLQSKGHLIYLVLRDKPIDDSITSGLNKNVVVVNPWKQDMVTISSEQSISPYELFSLLNSLDSNENFSHIILRAPRYLKAFHEKIHDQEYRNILSKVDAYFAKISIFEDDYELSIINKTKSNINRLIVQTEQMRSYVEQRFPELIRRVIVLNPMIPRVFSQNDLLIRKKIKNKSTIYAGKIDKNYLVEEYVDFSKKFQNMGYTVKLVGSKFNTPKNDKSFKTRFEKKVEENSIEWSRVLSREETMNMVSQSTFLVSIRDNIFDTDNELSTKLLESIASGTLPIINKSNINISVVGNDYPLFANNYDDISKVIDGFVLSFENYKKTLENLQKNIERFTFDNIYTKHLSSFFPKSLDNVGFLDNKNVEPKNVLIASHDNKFLVSILEKLCRLEKINVKFDNWDTTLRHDLKTSKSLLEWADIIICEWAVGPAVYYSNHKKPNQKLLVRLHRFEITTDQPAKIDFSKVDKMIVVSEYIKDFCIENYNWSNKKIDVIPQFANTHHFDRDKINGYNFNLGLLGFIPKLKRLDRSLDILEELRKNDNRYRLYIKSKMPWDVPFIWNREVEREYYIEQFKRIENSELLKGAVIFDDYGNDVSAWLRKIGWILSTSDIEGCHTAVAEAMSSGSQGVIFDWPGSDQVYKLNEIFTSTDKAAHHILSNSSFDATLISKQKEYCFDNFDISKTLSYYVDFVFSKTLVENK